MVKKTCSNGISFGIIEKESYIASSWILQKQLGKADRGSISTIDSAPNELWRHYWLYVDARDLIFKETVLLLGFYHM